MQSNIQEIEQTLKSIPSYSPQFNNLKEVGFIGKGKNSIGVFEYSDPVQNNSYAVKVFILSKKDNLNEMYEYLKNLNSQNQMKFDCIIKYIGFYFNISEKKDSIKINVVFEKYTGDLATLLEEEQLSYSQIKQLIEDIIFQFCELIGQGYVLQYNIALTEIKYIKSATNNYSVKFRKPFLIENIEQKEQIQEFWKENELSSFSEIAKCEILLLGVLILQLLGNYTKTMDNSRQTPSKFLKQVQNKETFDKFSTTIQKTLEMQNIEAQELMQIIKHMINKDQKKIYLPIQLYIKWLNFTNQQQFFPTNSNQQKNQSTMVKSSSNQNLQDIQNVSAAMSDEQLQKEQSENLSKEQQEGDDQALQDMIKEDQQGFNYPTLEEIQQNKKYTYKNGATYEGEWLNQKRHGQGTLITVKGSRFVGSWVEDKFTGKGTKYFYTGAVHEGNWKNNEANGYGIVTMPSGYNYEGNFENNKKHGYQYFFINLNVVRFGVQKLVNGTIFWGIFQNDMKIFGHFDYLSGNKYTGNLKNSKFTGFARFQWADGRLYHGNFNENQMDGPGIFNMIDGKVYQGCFQKNQYHGFGILSLPTGIEYGGAWVHSKLNGYGFHSNKGKAQLVVWKDSKIVKTIQKK